MIKEFIEKAKTEDILVEVFTTNNKTIQVKTRNKKVESTNTSVTKKYTIKAIYKNKVIKLYTDYIDSEKLISLIKENYEMLDVEDKTSFADEALACKNFIDTEVSVQQITNDLFDLYSLAEKHEEIHDLKIEYIYDCTEKSIMNDTIDIKDKNALHNFSVQAILLKGGIRKTSSFDFSFKKYDIKKFKEKLEEEIATFKDKLTEESVKTDNYKIILSNTCVRKLLNYFSFAFFAEDINKHTSLLWDKFNTQIFSNKINIIEDPTNEKLLGTTLFDSEGVKTYYKEIVKDGKFITKLYNKKSASEDKVASTGNSDGVRNLYIKPGNASFDDLMQKLKEGIFIENIQALFAGINKTTGEISVMAEGYLVKEGKKKKHLNMIILSTSLFELFNNVIEIGNDIEMNDQTCAGVSMLIDNIKIVGNKDSR